jgi:hypothetical protein
MARDPKLIQKEVIENFAKDLPQSYTRIVLHSDLSTLTWAPLMYRYPWDIIFGNICKGNVTVAGDAMHPMTPDLGQNECAALEDAVVRDVVFYRLLYNRVLDVIHYDCGKLPCVSFLCKLERNPW